MAERLPRYKSARSAPLASPSASFRGLNYSMPQAPIRDPFAGVAQALDKMSNFAFERLSEQRKLEWEEAGLTAPESVIEQLSGKKLSEMTKAERSGWDKASIVMSDRVEIQARKKIGEISLEGQANNLTPEEIAANIDDAVLGFASSLEGISPDRALKVQSNLTRLRESEYLKASARYLKQQEAEDRALGLEGIDVISRNIKERARVGVESQDFDLEDEIANLRTYMEHHRFTPGEIAKTEIDVRKDSNRERVRGGFYNNESLIERKKFLQRFGEAIESGKVTSYGLDVDDLRTLEREFRSDINADIAALKPRLDALRDRVESEIVSVVQDGASPLPAVLTAARQEIAELKALGVDTTSIEEKIANASTDAAIAKSFQTATLSELEAAEGQFIAAEREQGGLTGRQANMQDMLRKRIAKQKAALKRDSVEWGKRTGVITPGNFFIDSLGKDSGAIQEMASKRLEEAQAFAMRHKTDLVVFSDVEADTLTQQLSEATNRERIKILGLINRSFGASSYEVFKQISKKRPEYAHVGGLIGAGAAPKTINDAMVGIRLMQEDAVVSNKIQSQEFNAALEEQLSSFNLSPIAKKGIMDVAKAVYVGRQGPLDIADSDRIVDAIQDAAGRIQGSNGKFYGGIDSYKGVNVSIPTTIETGTLDDIIEKVSPAAFMDARVGGLPRDENGNLLNIEEIRDRGQLRLQQTAEQNLVLVRFEANGAIYYALNEAGGSFVINLEDVYRRSLPVPDIFSIPTEDTRSAVEKRRAQRRERR